jgi:hypothetical protein
VEREVGQLLAGEQAALLAQQQVSDCVMLYLVIHEERASGRT